MRNERKKRLGIANVSKTRKTTARTQLGSRKRRHHEEEVYEALYKDKIQTLYNTALAERLVDDSDNGSGDGDSEESKKAKVKEKQSTRMKIRREVRSKAWEMEDDEVKAKVRKELELENQELENLELGEKEGLARTPAQRQEYVFTTD
jgi:hypothetical protein